MVRDMEKNVLVFGASGGIGKAICSRLLEAGARVGGVSRDLSLLEGVKVSDKYLLESVSFEGIDSIVKSAKELWGKVDAVINCIGSVILKPAHLTSEEELRKTIHINLETAFAVLRAGVKAFGDSGGSVVLFGSAAAQTGLPNHEAIAASKGAVIALTKSAAASYAPKKVRINCICPGLTKTKMTERITSSEQAVQYSLKMHPLGRLGEPEDIAGLASFLVSDESSWMTGQAIGVDGGLGALKTQ